MVIKQLERELPRKELSRESGHHQGRGGRFRTAAVRQAHVGEEPHRSREAIMLNSEGKLDGGVSKNNGWRKDN